MRESSTICRFLKHQPNNKVVKFSKEERLKKRRRKKKEEKRKIRELRKNSGVILWVSVETRPFPSCAAPVLHPRSRISIPPLEALAASENKRRRRRVYGGLVPGWGARKKEGEKLISSFAFPPKKRREKERKKSRKKKKGQRNRERKRVRGFKGSGADYRGPTSDLSTVCVIPFHFFYTPSFLPPCFSPLCLFALSLDLYTCDRLRETMGEILGHDREKNVGVSFVRPRVQPFRRDLGTRSLTPSSSSSRSLFVTVRAPFVRRWKYFELFPGVPWTFTFIFFLRSFPEVAKR